MWESYIEFMKSMVEFNIYCRIVYGVIVLPMLAYAWLKR